MVWFFVAVILFMAGHILPAMFRKSLVARMGYVGYVTGFSVVSLLLLAWVIYEVINADSPFLWDYAVWQPHITLTLMFPACILWAAAILQPCPLSIGRKTGFDPQRPGINGFCRHPLLLGALLWGGGHVFPNGDLVAVLFFGGSALFALIGFWRVEKLRARDFAPDELAAVLAGTRRFYLPGVFKGAFGPGDIVLGSLIYAGLIILHGYVIGVSPLAFMGY